MIQKNILLGVATVVAIGIAGYFFVPSIYLQEKNNQDLDSTPKNVTLSGTYVCLPHLDTSGPQTMECAFGLKTDDGVYYAVNFGASANAMSQFQSGSHITAEGNVVIKEALSSSQWAKYNMKGIFTITRMIDPAPSTATGKININVVCEDAIAYMSFTDGKSADLFIKECKEGKHPEVIERYKERMGLGAGAAI